VPTHITDRTGEPGLPHIADFETRLGSDMLGIHEDIDAIADLYRRISLNSFGKPHYRYFTPRIMHQYLPNTVFFDILTLCPLALKIRFVGTHLTRLYGELTGQEVGDLPKSDMKNRILAVAADCIERAAPMVTLSSTTIDDTDYIKSLAFYAPLFDDCGNQNMIFTVAFTLPQTADTAERKAGMVTQNMQVGMPETVPETLPNPVSDAWI